MITPDLVLVLSRTLQIAVIITVLVVIFALPTAYFISRSKHKNLWLLLVVIPFWTNFFS